MRMVASTADLFFDVSLVKSLSLRFAPGLLPCSKSEIMLVSGICDSRGLTLLWERPIRSAMVKVSGVKKVNKMTKDERVLNSCLERLGPWFLLSLCGLNTGFCSDLDVDNCKALN